MPKKKQIVEESQPSKKKAKASTPTEDSQGTSSKNQSEGGTEMKIVSWNINGVRSWCQKGHWKWLKDQSPDIIVLQELKCGKSQIPKELSTLRGYKGYWQDSEAKKGYAGVGLLTKIDPVKVTFGMGIPQHDEEGRLLIAEYQQFYLIGAYVPNAGQGLKRLDYRKVWDKDFLDFATKLDKEKPIIYCGDLNVAHEEIDLANPKSNKNRTAGFTDQERGDFSKLLGKGFVDVYRRQNPTKTGAYTFWSSRGINSRANNIGWRLDYFVVSERLFEKVGESQIHNSVKGSDHCPISLEIEI